MDQAIFLGDLKNFIELHSFYMAISSFIFRSFFIFVIATKTKQKRLGKTKLPELSVQA
jgi:hypothetical protein